jgi:hypothetical protein
VKYKLRAVFKINDPASTAAALKIHLTTSGQTDMPITDAALDKHGDGRASRKR